MENKYQIIYSLKLMQSLVERGYFPVQTLPNPKDTRYKCWVFNKSQKGFTETFDQLLISSKSSKRGDYEDGSK